MPPFMRHSWPPLHLDSLTATLLASYYEHGFLPHPRAAGLPVTTPYPKPHDPELEHEVHLLRRRNADLENEVLEQYDTIDHLHEQNTSLRRDLELAHEQRQNDLRTHEAHHHFLVDDHHTEALYYQQNRETCGANTAQNPAAGLRQIETELSLLTLQSQTSLLASQIAALENNFALLEREVHDHEKCITVIAEVVSGTRMSGSEDASDDDDTDLSMRGGMGDRDEDEKFVYGYGGFTNWDQVEEEQEGEGNRRSKSRCGYGGQKSASIDDEDADADRSRGERERQQVTVTMAHMHELQHQINTLETQIERFGGTMAMDSTATQARMASKSSGPLIDWAEASTAKSPPNLRGGGGSHDRSIYAPLQSPPANPSNSSQDFSNIYTRHHHRPAPPHPRCPSTDSTEVWMNLATVLQLRNAFLERELKEYEQICESLMSDVRWQMGTQVELEELCEAIEGERDELLREVEGLKTGLRGGSDDISREASGSVMGAAGADALIPDDETPHDVPSTCHVPYTAFAYHPSTSTTTFPTHPLQNFHFPHGSEPDHSRPGRGWDEDIFPRSPKSIGVPPNSPYPSDILSPTPERAMKALHPKKCTQVHEAKSASVTIPTCDEDFWRHPKGRGCEEWATNLDRTRQRCTFCHLPFSGRDRLRRSSSAESISHEDNAPIPTSIPIFPYPHSFAKSTPKTSSANNTQPVTEAPVPDLRGGEPLSEISESSYSDHNFPSSHPQDWHRECLTLATQTHHSTQNHPHYRNSSTLSTKDSSRPATPIPRHKSQPRLDLPTSLFDKRGNKRYNSWYIRYGGLRVGCDDDGGDIDVLRDRELDDTIGVASKRRLATSQIQSRPASGDGGERVEQWRWFENPRPAPPVPVGRGDIMRRMGIFRRFSRRFKCHQDSNVEVFASSRGSR